MSAEAGIEVPAVEVPAVEVHGVVRSPGGSADPASCSALAHSLRRRATDLRRRADALADTAARLTSGWPGRAGTAHRRRALDLARATLRSAERLERAADAFQTHAVDLAEAAAARPMSVDDVIGIQLARRRARLVADLHGPLRCGP
ncbi:hypothetical protein [Janibacter sp. G56]|uniref:hypothetical protein n=1 Tax=Janibacter sp. G56 TaxID=3418717 RepID=UPI003D009DDD